MPEISVIISTLYEREAIDCIPCLERGDFDDYELILQDEYGASKARNEGIKRAAADKLVFLDDDSKPRENYLRRASRSLDEEAVVAGRVVHPQDNLFRRYFADHYDHGRRPTYVDTFVSCNMALRREVFESVGLFDENFVWGHEEKELAERVREAYDIYYDPELIVEHTYAESLIDFWFKRYRQETQRPYYWHKHGISTGGQLARTAYGAAHPMHYVGENITHSVARIGVTIAVTLGRLHGMVRDQFREMHPPSSFELPAAESTSGSTTSATPSTATDTRVSQRQPRTP